MIGIVNRKDAGFTLIELLVVILIIAILAAIAIPVFLRQREKSLISQAQNTLKNAATAAESYVADIDINGDYSGLDGDAGVILEANGFEPTTGITILVTANATEFCIRATHSKIPAGPEPNWNVSTFNSTDGSPTPSNIDAC